MKKHTPILKYLKFNKVFKCSSDLKKIANTKNRIIRNKLIKNAKDCVINAISEIAKNCLYGNIPLKSCDFNELKKYQVILRKLSSKLSINKRRKIIIQKGGFISPLVTAALSLIIPIVTDILKRRLSRK